MARTTRRSTEDNRLIARFAKSEKPAQRRRRIARKRVDPAMADAIRRLSAEDLDLSRDDVIYRARQSLNAAKGGRARAKKLSAARRHEIAKLANASRRKAARHV